MGSSAVLAVAAVALLIGCWDRGLLARLDTTTGLWVGSVTGWPIVVIYAIAPLLWSDAPSAGSKFTVLLYAPAVLCSLAAVGRALARDRLVVDPAAAMLASLFVGAGVAMVIDSSDKHLNLIIAVLIFAGFVLRTSDVSLAQVGDAARVALVGSVVCVLASVTFNASAVVGDCRIDKCTDIGAALTSPFAGNGNLAGIMVTALLPFVAYRAEPLRVIALVVGVGAVGLLAGSRTAFIGIGVACAGSLLLSTDPHRRLRDVGLGVLFLGSLVFSFFPLYAGYSETDFSLRGYLWNEARRLIPDQLMFGYNPAYWVDSGRSTLFTANYSPHNGWFEILLSTGVWGAVVIVVAAVVKTLSVTHRERGWLVVYFATILCISSMEAVYVPYFLGIAPFAAILPFFVYRGAHVRAPHVKEPV